MDPLDGITISLADPDDPAVRPLIAAHLAHAGGAAPQSSYHTMNSQALKDSAVRFRTLSDATDVLGCGGLKPLPDGTEEVKSLHIRHAARGRGLARRLMVHLIDTARKPGTQALVLETRATDDYSVARRLYTALCVWLKG